MRHMEALATKNKFTSRWNISAKDLAVEQASLRLIKEWAFVFDARVVPAFGEAYERLIAGAGFFVCV